MNPTTEENKLTAWLKEGDEPSFRAFYRQSYPELIRYGRSVSADGGAVQDAVQNLFVWSWQNPDRLRGVDKPDSYLYRSLRNNLLGGIQKNDNRNRILLQREATHDTERITLQPELQDDDRVGQYLSRMLDMLPGRQMEIIYLRFYRNKSFAEIGEIMGVSAQVAQNYATRAINKLRGGKDQLRRLITGCTFPLILAYALLCLLVDAGGV